MTSLIPPDSEGGGVWLISRLEVAEVELVDCFGLEGVLDLDCRDCCLGYSEVCVHNESALGVYIECHLLVCSTYSEQCARVYKC